MSEQGQKNRFLMAYMSVAVKILPLDESGHADRYCDHDPDYPTPYDCRRRPTHGSNYSYQTQSIRITWSQ